MENATVDTKYLAKMRTVEKSNPALWEKIKQILDKTSEAGEVTA